MRNDSSGSLIMEVLCIQPKNKSEMKWDETGDIRNTGNNKSPVCHMQVIPVVSSHVTGKLPRYCRPGEIRCFTHELDFPRLAKQ